MRTGSARADSDTIRAPSHPLTVVSGLGLSGQPWTINMVIDHDNDPGQGSSSEGVASHSERAGLRLQGYARLIANALHEYLHS